MADIVDRLESVTRSFERAAFFGVGALTDMLTPACGVGTFINADTARARLAADGARLVADEEQNPFAPASLDLIVSLLTLHNANDVIGALAQHRASLKPDGLMVAALFGEETLKSLKAAFYRAEAELTSGASARFHPFASVKDLGQALQRAGFALPVADVDPVSVRYRDPLQLFRDLKGMGETNALKTRGRALTRAVFARAMALFAEDGGEARFDIVYLTGWAPDPSQQKPLKPGSATRSLEQAVKAARR